MYLHNEKDSIFCDLSRFPFIFIEEGCITEKGKADEPLFIVMGQTYKKNTFRLAFFKNHEIAKALFDLIALDIQIDDYASVIRISKEGAITRVGEDAHAA